MMVAVWAHAGGSELSDLRSWKRARIADEPIRTIANATNDRKVNADAFVAALALADISAVDYTWNRLVESLYGACWVLRADWSDLRHVDSASTNRVSSRNSVDGAMWIGSILQIHMSRAKGNIVWEVWRHIGRLRSSKQWVEVAEVGSLSSVGWSSSCLL
jgi:hypothetical protein